MHAFPNLLLGMLGNFPCLLFSKNSFRKTISVSNSLDLGSVGPDLAPNCLQRLSADNKSCCLQGKDKVWTSNYLNLSNER